MLRFENHILTKATHLAVVVVFALSQPNIAAAAPSTDLLKEAQALLEQHKTDAALACLNAQIKKEPKNALAYSERSLAYGAIGKYSQALTDSNKAISLNPRLAIAYANRAAIYIVTSRSQNALDDSNKAIELQPNMARAYSMRALVYERLKSFQKEIDDCDRAIAIDPKTARYYTFRASAYRNLGQYEKALKDCSVALSLNPKHESSYRERGYVYACLGKFNAAVEDYSAAIRISPQSAEAYSLRADAYCELGQYQKVIDDLSVACKIGRKKDSCLYERIGCAYLRLGKFQKAIDYYTTAIRIAPRSSHAYLLRADAYQALGQFQKSIDGLALAVKLCPKDAAVFEKRGYAYLRLDKFQKAVDDFTAAIKISRNSADAYSLRAFAFSKLGQYSNQIDDLTLAIKISPRDADLYERRGGAHYELGQLQDALADCNMAIKLAPSSVDASLTAADACEELLLLDKALELRNKLLKRDLNDAYRWNARAKVYERLGKYELALADRRKASELASPSDRLHMQGCSPLVDFSKLSAGVENPQGRINEQLKNNKVVLPFKYDDGCHICVPAHVNGRPLRLMLDTGCGHSDIWKQAMPGLAEMDKTLLVGTKANGKEYSFGSFRARDLKLGDLTLSNVAMGVHEGLVGHKTLSGFLGGNILENFVVTVDYRNKQVFLAKSFDQSSVKNAIVVPMMVRNHQPHCSVMLDRKLETTAQLDTGCPFSLSAASLLKPILTRKLNYTGRTSGPWLGELSCEGVRLKSISLGGANFESPIFDVFPAAQAPGAAATIYLGNDFLSGFKAVTFDYPARRIIFEPDEASSKSAMHLYREGRFYLAHHEEKRAIDSFTKAIDLDRELAPLCYFYRGLAFECLKQYEPALADCNAVIKLDAKAYRAYHLRALIYHALGRQQLAESDLMMEKKLKGH